MAVAEHVQDKLAGITSGEMEFIEASVGLREANLEVTGLDPSTFALVKIAALIAPRVFRSVASFWRNPHHPNASPARRLWCANGRHRLPSA